MRSLLLAVLALCLASLVSGQAVIQTLTYTTNNCQGNATATTNTQYNLNILYNSTSGSTYDGTSFKLFADTTAGAYVTIVYYADQGVTQYSQNSLYYYYIYTANAIINVCNPFGLTGSQKVVITNFAQGPAAPAVPSGWATSVNTFNATTFTQITTCPVPTSGVVTLNGYTGNVCRPFVNLNGATPVQFSQYGFCFDGGLFWGTAQFAGAGCTGSVLLASVSAAGVCNNGVTSSCSGSNSLPSSFPNQGVVKYSSASHDCSNADGLATVYLTTQYTGASSCVPQGSSGRWSSFTCSTINGTLYGTSTTYSDQCVTPVAGTTLQNAAEATNTGGNSVSGATSLNNFCFSSAGQYNAFTCNFLASSSSSVSVSAVALLFAAVLSLFASRQL